MRRRRGHLDARRWSCQGGSACCEGGRRMRRQCRHACGGLRRVVDDRLAQGELSTFSRPRRACGDTLADELRSQNFDLLMGAVWVRLRVAMPRSTSSSGTTRATWTRLGPFELVSSGFPKPIQLYTWGQGSVSNQFRQLAVTGPAYNRLPSGGETWAPPIYGGLGGMGGASRGGACRGPCAGR